MIDRLAKARAFDLLAMSSVIGGLVFQEETEKKKAKDYETDRISRNVVT